MDTRKRAAVSAVIAYIKQEEDVACAVAMQSRSAIQPSVQPALVEPLKMWGLSGRQTMMQLRSMMQIKAFHGFRH